MQWYIYWNNSNINDKPQMGWVVFAAAGSTGKEKKIGSKSQTGVCKVPSFIKVWITLTWLNTPASDKRSEIRRATKRLLCSAARYSAAGLSLSRSFTAALQYADQRRWCIYNDPSEEMTDCCSASESFSISSVAGEFLKAKCGAGILALYASVPL